MTVCSTTFNTLEPITNLMNCKLLFKLFNCVFIISVSVKESVKLIIIRAMVLLLSQELIGTLQLTVGDITKLPAISSKLYIEEIIIEETINISNLLKLHRPYVIDNGFMFQVNSINKRIGYSLHNFNTKATCKQYIVLISEYTLERT